MAAPPPSPIAMAINAALDDKATTAKAHSDDVAAVKAFYASRAEYVFASASGWTERAKAIISEMSKAADWGLDATAFTTPDLAAGADVTAQGAAEAKLALAALKYARHARGGRFDPRSVSNILDVSGEIKDPAAVIAELTQSATPDAVLRDLHPKHKEFEALRQALLKARGPATATIEPEIDPALKVKLPEGNQKSLKPGVEHDDVVLLRQRLKVASASGGNDRLYDTAVEAAVAAFQSANELKANGVVNNRTRRALNSEGEPKKTVDASRDVDQLIVNMERWRWLPADMGAIYVWNNIPEYMGRVIAGGEPVFEEKIIVGLPTWPTPMLTDSLEKVVFNPEWGVPDGIKVKELLPRLRRASGSGDFFEQLFSGGSSGGGRVLAAYGLKPSLNGRPVDPDSINWNNVDIRRYSFTQPAGAQNPLGTVKFMFPNRHDVYMHDTSQRPLFQQARRALSHGCIRVENPKTLAEILLDKDKGWSAEKVASMYGGGTNEVLLDKPVPVYLTYFTARPGADGKINAFADIYGHDSRLLAALSGRPVRYEPPQSSGDDVIADATPAGDPIETSSTTKKKSKKQKSYDGDLISNALSGLLFN
ncbi:MAG: L,D-transpeptidase family protein [Hyphomicrobium sp.]